MSNDIQINTQEYTRKLEQLQHGIITMDEWRRYCDEIRNSIAAEKYLENSTNVEP